jgi:hypothetical protein
VSFFHRICPHTGKSDLLGLAPHFEIYMHIRQISKCFLACCKRCAL